ncbi:MAG TPA: hypothetical protein DIS79_02475, partial [Bacteroidetes bacterium]|nr:hypothetical protein [Bacteroidota bacterium]
RTLSASRYIEVVMSSGTLAPLPLTRPVFWILVCVYGLLTFVTSIAQLQVFDLPIDDLRGYTHQSSDGSIWRSGPFGTWRLNTDSHTWDVVSNTEAILIDPPFIVCRDTETNTFKTSYDGGTTFVEDRPRISSWTTSIVVFDDVMYTYEGDQVLGSLDSGLTWDVYAESPIQLIGNINALYRRGDYVIAEYDEWVHRRYTTVVFRKQFHSLIKLFEVGNDHVDAKPLNLDVISLRDGLYEFDIAGDSLRHVITLARGLCLLTTTLPSF